MGTGEYRRMERERFDTVCSGIAEGLSVKAACTAAGMDDMTFWKALRRDEELVGLYARARESRSDVRFEGLSSLAEKIEMGLIEPQAAKVLMDMAKWQCGKEKPRVYGDSTTIKGDKDNPIAITALAAALDERLAPPVIEHKTPDLPRPKE